ncbi:MAG: HEAT repeat domain-containing protein [Planctomycetaceae bacterium]|jgi:hypothetical protein|nr:HEAT repeat domain-containing protein [Planctomycetaceae bacterium]
MTGKRWVCFLIMLLMPLFFGGCSLLTISAVRLPFDESDPFLAAANRENVPPVPETILSAANEEKISPAQEEDETLLEPEHAHQMTEAEQAELLSQNQWVKNLAMINYLDSGRKPAADRQRQTADRQRQDEINTLNMSAKEQAKKKNQRFEYADGSASEWRWMHRGVDKLCAVPPEHRVSPEVFLRSSKYKGEKHRILRANAAILMGRDGDDSVTKYLKQLVKNEAAEVRLRCAAAEVLGQMENTSVEDLIPLIDSVKERDMEVRHPKTGEITRQHFPGVTDIWSELLIAAAKKTDPWNHSCFLEPLTASSSEIRYEAAKIWRRYSESSRFTSPTKTAHRQTAD